MITLFRKPTSIRKSSIFSNDYLQKLALITASSTQNKKQQNNQQKVKSKIYETLSLEVKRIHNGIQMYVNDSLIHASTVSIINYGDRYYRINASSYFLPAHKHEDGTEKISLRESNGMITLTIANKQYITRRIVLKISNEKSTLFFNKKIVASQLSLGLYEVENFSSDNTLISPVLIDEFDIFS